MSEHDRHEDPTTGIHGLDEDQKASGKVTLDFSRMTALDIQQLLLDAYNATPIVDDPRVEANAFMGREVVDEFPAIWARRDVTDDDVRLPIRLSYIAGVGFTFEIGPYDVVDRDVTILKAAIASWDRINYGPILGTKPPVTQLLGKPAVAIEVRDETTAEGDRGVETDG